MLSQESRWVSSVGYTKARSKYGMRICLPHALASIYANASFFVIKVGISIEAERRRQCGNWVNFVSAPSHEPRTLKEIFDRNLYMAEIRVCDTENPRIEMPVNDVS